MAKRLIGFSFLKKFIFIHKEVRKKFILVLEHSFFTGISCFYGERKSFSYFIPFNRGLHDKYRRVGFNFRKTSLFNTGSLLHYTTQLHYFQYILTFLKEKFFLKRAVFPGRFVSVFGNFQRQLTRKYVVIYAVASARAVALWKEFHHVGNTLSSFYFKRAFLQHKADSFVFNHVFGSFVRRQRTDMCSIFVQVIFLLEFIWALTHIKIVLNRRHLILNRRTITLISVSLYLRILALTLGNSLAAFLILKKKLLGSWNNIRKNGCILPNVIEFLQFRTKVKFP